MGKPRGEMGMTWDKVQRVLLATLVVGAREAMNRFNRNWLSAILESPTDAAAKQDGSVSDLLPS